MSVSSINSVQKPSTVKAIGLIVGPLLFIYFLFFSSLDPEQPAVSATLAVAFLMAVCWINDSIPLAVTYLIHF